jgi:glycerophosphoryl diester phosphodiesterase
MFDRFWQPYGHCRTHHKVDLRIRYREAGLKVPPGSQVAKRQGGEIRPGLELSDLVIACAAICCGFSLLDSATAICVQPPGGVKLTWLTEAGEVAGLRMRVLTIAHRGASGSFPENTLCAFRAAIEAAADACELDVRLTSDNAAVVIHDETVDRTTDGHGPVAAMTLEELKRLDAGGGFAPRFRGERIPTLEETFTLAAGRCGLHVELKAEGVERSVGAIVRAHDALENSMASSFDWEMLARARAAEPRLRIALLAEKEPERLIEAARAMKADAVNPRFDMVSAGLCAAAHRRGLKVYTWTVDVPELMEMLIEMGVDGIATNYPERMRAVVGR